jgi:hypothetical protein
VQWELAGRLGPPPGRYVLRRFAGDDAQAVIVVRELGAPIAAVRRTSRWRRRVRPRRVAPPPAAPRVPVTRVTVVEAKPLRDATAWLAHAAREPAALGDAAHALTRLVAAHRIAVAAPLPDPELAAALAVRVGYGTGAQVAEGGWESALELSAQEIAWAAPRRALRRRAGAPAGADRLAALLAGRDAALACEELTLRARTDLDHDRAREAALQLEAALTAALAELAGWRDLGDMARRLDELRGYAEPVATAASAAREGRLDAAGVETTTAALARLEAALRARALHAG